MLIIGIDGGATKVSGAEVILKDNNISLGKIKVLYRYSEIEGYNPKFKPVDLDTQIYQKQNKNIKLTPEEEQQAKIYIKTVFKVIQDIVNTKSDNEVLIGIGMPGLKSFDAKGIEVFINGPRIPNFVSELEELLKQNNINLIKPIVRIGSDADYCGIGEEHAQDGLFRDVANAYYIGGGTGLADVMKLNHKLVFFDSAKDWIAKSWEMCSSEGQSFEKYISSKSILEKCSEVTGVNIEEFEKQGFIILSMKQFKNDNKVKGIIHQTAKVLAELLFERIYTLYNGSNNDKKFIDPNRPKLNKNHPYRNNVFERIILGQRLGEIWNDAVLKHIFQVIVKKELTRYILNSDLDIDVKRYYIPNKKLKEDLIVSSNLKEAPILGAAIDALIYNGFYNV